jgi:hypothetical protein
VPDAVGLGFTHTSAVVRVWLAARSLAACRLLSGAWEMVGVDVGVEVGVAVGVALGVAVGLAAGVGLAGGLAGGDFGGVGHGDDEGTTPAWCEAPGLGAVPPPDVGVLLPGCEWR